MSRASDIPQVPAWFQNGFHGFLRRFLKRHFHAIAVDRQSRHQSDLDTDVPLIVYGNHPSWWDPLIAHFLNRSLFPGRQFYAPIDADALEQYRVFGKLGFYGVKTSTPRGAAAFLKQSVAIVNSGNAALWLTPEGKFADARDHTTELMPGLAHLCQRMRVGVALPLVLEYVFWDERLPVCLAKMGDPIDMAQHPAWDKADWAAALNDRMRSAQSDLATLAIARSCDAFDNLLRGRVGAGMFYDSARRMKSWTKGQRLRARHGEQFE